MHMNSLFLEAFFTCVQMGSFTKAAKRLSITQSALSQRIKNLETELATTLIIRDRAGLRVTPSGEEVVRFCKMKLEAETELRSKLHSKPGGHLAGLIRIGGYSSVNRSLILPALSPILKRNPEVSIRLVTQEIHELMPLLQSGEIDFMVVDREVERDGVASHLLGWEKNVLIQKKGYGCAEIYLDHDEEDLTTLNYFKLKSASSLKRRYLDDVYGVIDGVKNGLGKAIVPLHLISQSKNIEILNPEKVIKSPIYLHYYEQAFYARLHHEVVTHLTTWFAE